MAVTFSSAFYHYHLLKNLGVDYTYIAYMMIVNNFVAMLVYRILGKVSDRVGHKTIAEFGIILASLSPVCGFHEHQYLQNPDGSGRLPFFHRVVRYKPVTRHPSYGGCFRV